MSRLRTSSSASKQPKLFAFGQPVTIPNIVRGSISAPVRRLLFRIKHLLSSLFGCWIAIPLPEIATKVVALKGANE